MTALEPSKKQRRQVKQSSGRSDDETAAEEGSSRACPPALPPARSSSGSGGGQHRTAPHRTAHRQKTWNPPAQVHSQNVLHTTAHYVHHRPQTNRRPTVNLSNCLALSVWLATSVPAFHHQITHCFSSFTKSPGHYPTFISSPQTIRFRHIQFASTSPACLYSISFEFRPHPITFSAHSSSAEKPVSIAHDTFAHHENRSCSLYGSLDICIGCGRKPFLSEYHPRCCLRMVGLVRFLASGLVACPPVRCALDRHSHIRVHPFASEVYRQRCTAVAGFELMLNSSSQVTQNERSDSDFPKSFRHTHDSHSAARERCRSFPVRPLCPAPPQRHRERYTLYQRAVVRFVQVTPFQLERRPAESLHWRLASGLE
jgi:hypothetical protein